MASMIHGPSCEWATYHDVLSLAIITRFYTLDNLSMGFAVQLHWKIPVRLLKAHFQTSFSINISPIWNLVSSRDLLTKKCASVTKQYNLVLARGRWCPPRSGEETAGRSKTSCRWAAAKICPRQGLQRKRAAAVLSQAGRAGPDQPICTIQPAGRTRRPLTGCTRQTSDRQTSDSIIA